MTQKANSVAQPIICCIGESVAGQPTQFLVERAAASCETDWRAISVEVPPEKFEAACNGMLAMRFQGLRIFGSYQRRAVNALAAEYPSALFVGYLTSGMPSDNGWVLWDHVGYAWIDLLIRKAGDRAAVIWLHGDSRTTRSVFVALVARGGTDVRWLWTQSPPLESDRLWPKDITQWVAEGRITENPDIAAMQEQLSNCAAGSDQLTTGKYESLAVADSSEGISKKNSNTKVTEEAPERSKTLVGLITEAEAVPEEVIRTLYGLPIELITSVSNDFPLEPGTLQGDRVSPAELAVAGEAFDFHRWTGYAIDPTFLQDAYDEYCDF